MESTPEEVKYEVREGFLSSPSLSHPHIDLAPVYNFTQIKEISSKKVDLGSKKKKSKLKLVETSPIPYPKINIIDVKLQARGMFEDQLYLSNIDLLKNIRRGNSFLQFTAEDGTQKTIVGRKGMIKFYDISTEMLSEGAEEREITKKDGKNRLVDDKKMGFTQMNVTLAGPYSALNQGYNVEMVKTLKANGENAQVAWNEELQMWIFCSKNVAMLAKTREDLDEYDQSDNPLRFQFSKLIAKCWFDKLDEIEANGHNISDLKKDISSKTLIGEYCGDPNHIHLILYPKIRLIFYTIVSNGSLTSPEQSSIDSCILPEQSMAIFKKYGLETVTYESLGVFESYESMKESLREVYTQVAKAKISTDEEGSVIYFIRRKKDEEQEEDRVLSLAKLKTMEYRLYRKLREKTRNTSARLQNKGTTGTAEKRAWEEVIRKFKSESKDLIKGFTDEEKILTEEELEFYFSLTQAAVDKVCDDNEQQTYVQENYLMFLKELLEGMGEDGEDRLTSRIFEIQDEIDYVKA